MGTPGEVGSVTEGSVVAVSPADTPIAIKNREGYELLYLLFGQKTEKCKNIYHGRLCVVVSTVECTKVVK